MVRVRHKHAKGFGGWLGVKFLRDFWHGGRWEGKYLAYVRGKSREIAGIYEALPRDF